MARVPHTGTEFYNTYEAQKNYLFRVSISEAPNALAGIPIPNVDFFFITANSPDYETEVKDIAYKGMVIPKPIKDSSPRVFNTRIRFMSNSDVLNYMRAWKLAVSNPNSGYMLNAKDVAGSLKLEALDSSGEYVTNLVILERAFPTSLKGATYDVAGSDFVEIDATFRYVSWIDEMLPIPS